ncbi:MAG: hypothetical protein AVDCRST_MAG11-1524, partial [uncultured Gemmatimonadaceae bacterium]
CASGIAGRPTSRRRSAPGTPTCSRSRRTPGQPSSCSPGATGSAAPPT